MRYRPSIDFVESYPRQNQLEPLCAYEVFADISNSSNVSTIKLVWDAPSGRTVRPGTNVKVRCPCIKYDTISPIDFGMIELSQYKFECPNCHFHRWSPGLQVSFPWHQGIRHPHRDQLGQSQESAMYQLFDPKKRASWSRLVIKSPPLEGDDDCPLCLLRMNEDEIDTLDCSRHFHEACLVLRNADTYPRCDFQEILASGKRASGAPCDSTCTLK